MSNRQRLMNSINKLGKKSKAVVRLPVTPAMNHQRHVPTNTDWQINWINEFAACKEEAMSTKNKLEEEMKGMAAKLKKQHEMLVKTSRLLEKKDQKIAKYKSRWIEAAKKVESVEVGTNTDQKECVDMGTNTEQKQVQCVDVATNTDNTAVEQFDVELNTDPFPSEVLSSGNDASMLVDHDYAIKFTRQSTSHVSIEQTAANSSDRMVLCDEQGGENEAEWKDLKIYKCPNCDYTTSKSDNLKTHRAESCVDAPHRDRKCKYCQKMFTRRQLRVHINNYVRAAHNPTGSHRNVSMDEHVEYLAEIKAEVKTKTVH